MIELTDIDGTPLMLNPRHIKSVELLLGHTKITMTSGDAESSWYVVRESMDDVRGLLKQGGRR